MPGLITGSTVFWSISCHNAGKAPASRLQRSPMCGRLQSVCRRKFSRIMDSRIIQKERK